MKKLVVFVILSLLILPIFVSAQNTIASETLSGVRSIASFIESFVDEVKPLVFLLVGGSGGDSALNSNYLFAKFLFLILLISVIWIPVKTLPFVGETRNGLAFTISLIVSLLSVRFLSEQIISTILLPYTVIGISITAFLPLVMYFVWIEKGLVGTEYRVIRKAAWIFALVVFVSLYFVRLPLLNPPVFAIVYLIAGVLCLLFFFFDKTIQKAFIRSKYEGLEDVRNIEGKGMFVEKMADMQKRWINGHLSDSDYKKAVLRYKGQAGLFGIPLPDVSDL